MTFAGWARYGENMPTDDGRRSRGWRAKQTALRLAVGFAVGSSPMFLPAYLWIPLTVAFAFWLGLAVSAFWPRPCLFCGTRPALPVFAETGRVVPALSEHWWDLRPPPRRGVIDVCFVHLISYADGRLR